MLVEGGFSDKMNPKAFRYFQTPDETRNKSKRIITETAQQVVMDELKKTYKADAMRKGVDLTDVL